MMRTGPERDTVRSGDAELSVYQWELPKRVRARVLLTHGLGEFAGRYAHVAGCFAEQGIALFAYDQRGHGLSTGRRGDARRYNELTDDLVAVRTHFGGEGWFHFGHSFGAQILLRAVLERNLEPRGLILSAPWLGLARTAPRWKLAAARWAMRWMPGLRFSTGIRREMLSADAEFLAAVQGDARPHRLISARLFGAGCETAEWLQKRVSALNAPVLLVQGEEDPVTSRERTGALFAAIGSTDKTIRWLPGMRHEPHNEAGRDAVLALFRDWILARV